MLSITKVLILYLLGILLLGSVTPGYALVRRYKFVLTNSAHTRLCTNKTMLTINGQFPGPTIYARRGDLVIVDVYNRAGHNITIHWHGVKMPRYPWSDGPEYVTQCPISPGTKFSQRIVLSDEEGTLWWHAHSEWSRASVYGALIILPQKRNDYPFLKPHAEVPILLGEWWNADVQEVMEEFLATGGDPNVSDAFLINSQPGDLYPCSRRDTFKLSVEHGKTYLIRMVNAVMNNIMFFRIANHTVTVVGTDGAYTKNLQSDYITISPGQTIDFLLHADQPPSHYYMASRVYASGGNYDNTTTTGIVEYVGNYTPPPTPLLPPLPPFQRHELVHELHQPAPEPWPTESTPSTSLET
ncbi:laccase-15 [Phtheirospermum japonicum]|uniref:laccase n=1 Tax=Phtheirospermum japonicum TaxID=374723 RepID=A0A830B2Y7_9LAMI|nr:laccase-15 [Phtheirospermum japonicum]